MCSVQRLQSALIHGLTWYVHFCPHSGDLRLVPVSLPWYVSLSQPSDSYERVKEAVVRTMISGWLPGTEDDQEQHDQWVNPNEVCPIITLHITS